MTATETVSLSGVIAAYQLLLGRPPEEAVLVTYGERIKRNALTRSQLVDALLHSDEYRASCGTADKAATAIELGGFKVFIRPNDQDIGQVVAQEGAYEPYVVSAFRERVTLGMQVIDVGANIGFYTMLAAHLVGPQGKVFAFEPADKNVQLLCSATIANAFHNIEIFPVAAGSRNEIVSIKTHDNTSNCELHDIPAQASPGAMYAVVRILDELLASVERIDVVKIDVEGFEPRALQGMARLLSRSRPVIFTEFHPQALRRTSKIDAREYARMLFTLGTDVMLLDRDGQRYRCESPEHVMNQWEAANQRAGVSGSLHLDLMVTQESAG